MTIEAMKQALEALDRAYEISVDADDEHPVDWALFCEFLYQERSTLRAAIEQAEKRELFGYFQYAMHFDAWVQNRDSNKGVAFYTTPPAAPVQEPLIVKLKDDWRTDDWGKPIIYDTDEVDEVTGALTGDEGEEDSLTVLNSMVRYVSNVWPGKTALQVLIECEEAMIATPPAAQRQWVGLTDGEISAISREIYGYEIEKEIRLACAIEAKLREKNGGQA